MYKMDDDTIRHQSLSAYKQWHKQWAAQAKEHSKFKMKRLTDFENTGIGRACLLIANGFSFEENLETIKQNQHNVDVFACDKTLGHCLDNGIIPKFVLVCDANVSYEKYMEKWKDKLQNTVLFINVCGNPKWSSNGNWKDIYFFVNEDIIESHKEFAAISGCENIIPAATNVSNAMVVFVTQSNNVRRCNFFGYDKILLIGFDYCWRPDGNYYAFDHDGEGKYYYMKHIYGMTAGQKTCWTSTNLTFSANWLEKYISTFKLPVVQCASQTILQLASKSLESQITYRHNPEDMVTVNKLLRNKNEMAKQIREIDEKLKQTWKDHNQAYLASVC